jgi:predicted flap endonuclease-1-like 5' DNA nuclease
MKKSDLSAFWFGLITTAVLSFLLYKYLRPRREVAPRPLLVTRIESPEAKQAVAPEVRRDSRKVKQVVAPEVRKDSLVSIRGIGPATEKKLNEAGIESFAQLADMTPKELEPFTGSRWDPEEWIIQARSF